jgi:ABC-type transport system involved in multi-copper enzyme maturation permease subunit
VIVKEVRAARWAMLVGLGILLLHLLSVVTVNLKSQSLGTLNTVFDADFSVVATGHIAAGAAYLWATFFDDLTLYLLVGVGGAILGAGLVASEIESGSIFILLSRPISRAQALLTKYGIAAGCGFALCALSGCLAVVIGDWQGIASPPFWGVILSITLLWLGMLFVMSLTLLYSLLIPQALAAGVLGFFTTYLLNIVPVIHTSTSNALHPTYLLGTDWSLVSYWSSLGIYSGTMNPLKALVVAILAAMIPAGMALVLFMRKAF